MAILFVLKSRKLYAMVNKVSLTIIGREHSKSLSINAQVFVNGEKDVIPLSVKIEPKYFDTKARRVKPSHPQALDYNAIIANAQDRAAMVLKEANQANKRLTKETFRARFSTTLSDVDFVAYWTKEHEARKGSIEHSTWKQHKASLKKFKSFKRSVPFDLLTPAFIQDYERWLIRRGDGVGTVATALKNVNTYINLAIKAGIDIKNPFMFHKISYGKGEPTFLTIEETHVLLNKYNSGFFEDELKESLLVFLVQAFTSFRISDAVEITEKWINDGQLKFVPYKNRRYKKVVSFGLSDIALKLLQDLFELKRRKQLKPEQKINVDLKLIAAHAGIRKTVTTHVARHTFATSFLELGGDVVVLNKILGHSKLETTMIYVHILDKRKTEQVKNFDNEFKPNTMLLDLEKLKKEKDLFKALPHQAKAKRFLNENVAEEMSYQLRDFKMGTDVHFSTDGRWSLHDLIVYILKQTGPAELYFCTYAIKEYQARLFSNMKETGLLTNIFALVDYRIGVHDPGAEQLLKASCKKLGYMRTHAKLVAIKNEKWGMVIAGSANLTANTRGDVGVITCDTDITDYRINWILKNIDRGTNSEAIK